MAGLIREEAAMISEQMEQILQIIYLQNARLTGLLGGLELAFFAFG
jgi:hypothetical protein